MRGCVSAWVCGRSGWRVGGKEGEGGIHACIYVMYAFLGGICMCMVNVHTYVHTYILFENHENEQSMPVSGDYLG